MRADVRRHDDDGVFEIDRSSLPVRDPPVIEHLQQHVEHVLVRFLDFIEEHHRIRLAPDRFAQLPAFFVADVTRRRTDQARDGVFLHVFAHVDPDHGLLVIEQKFRERARQFRFPHPGWPKENERTDRAILVLQSGARSTDRVGHCFDRCILADDALMQMFLEPEQFFPLTFLQPRHRNVRPTRDDLRDIFLRHFFA